MTLNVEMYAHFVQTYFCTQQDKILITHRSDIIQEHQKKFS
jgi:hypothetical protein